MISSVWLPIMFVILAMVFALLAMMFYIQWANYAKRKNKKLLKQVERKGLFGKKFIHPGRFAEYCVKKDKLDDNKTIFYKHMYIISLMIWLLFFLVSFVIFAVIR